MVMRPALAATLLAACIVEPTTSDPPPSNETGWGSGWGGSSGTTDWGCHMDSQCPTSYVCARDGECLPASAVRTIHVVWTLKGQPASDATCSQSPQLDITFSDSSGDLFGFAPVPCNAGKYTIDKFPASYTTVDLVRAGDRSGGGHGSFDATGT